MTQTRTITPTPTRTSTPACILAVAGASRVWAATWYGHEAPQGQRYRVDQEVAVDAPGEAGIVAAGSPLGHYLLATTPGGLRQRVCGEYPASVFADGFESGSTARWSTRSP